MIAKSAAQCHVPCPPAARWRDPGPGVPAAGPDRRARQGALCLRTDGEKMGSIAAGPGAPGEEVA